MSEAKPASPITSSHPAFVRAPAVVVVAVGFAISLGAFWVARSRARAEWRATFEREAGEVSAALINGLDVPLEALQSLPALFASSDEVTRAEFRAFVTPTLARHPAIYAFEWLPEVPGAERAKWEERARAEGVKDFRFTEVGPSLEMVPAKPRARHVPLFYMEPPEPKALGFDIASDPMRVEPFDRAKQSGRAVASGRIRLVEDPPGVHSIAVFQPVHRARPGASPEYLGAGVEVFRLRPARCAATTPSATRSRSATKSRRRRRSASSTRSLAPCRAGRPASARRFRSRTAPGPWT